MRRKLLLSAALAMVYACAASQAAMAAEAIVAFEAYQGKYAVLSPNGGSYSFVNCGGDLNYSGSTRYFAHYVVGTTELPYGVSFVVYNTELAVSDRDCQRTQVLTSQGNMLSDRGLWSPDGTMIAANVEEFDLANGMRTWQGIAIFDVMYSGGQPVTATKSVLGIPTGANRNFTWTPDSRRIVYVEAGINGADLFSYSLDGGTVTNLTNTPGVAEDQPTYSSRERIAYVRQTSAPRGSYRYDVFTIPASGGPELQVTNKATTGAFANLFPCYSPDGLQLAFSSGVLTWGDNAIYRIRADGSGKAVKVVGAKGQNWRRCFWRP